MQDFSFVNPRFLCLMIALSSKGLSVACNITFSAIFPDAEAGLTR